MSDPSRHVFGANVVPLPVAHQPTADYHERRAKLQADFEAEQAKLDARHQEERDALAKEFDKLHKDNARLAGLR